MNIKGKLQKHKNPKYHQPLHYAKEIEYENDTKYGNRNTIAYPTTNSNFQNLFFIVQIKDLFR